MRVLGKQIINSTRVLNKVLIQSRFMESDRGSCSNTQRDKRNVTNKNQKRTHVQKGDKHNKKIKTIDTMANLKKVELVTEDVQSDIMNNVFFQMTPTKSESDSKLYLAVKLANGLQALLISDVNNIIDPSELEKNTAGDQSDSECSDSSSDNSCEKGKDKSGINNSECVDLEASESEEDTATDDPQYEQKEKLAACALTVGVGSFSDPEEIPGLAHFLEHMVFMGSEKYPKENDFDSYISTRGGSDNASTECEHTTFYFDCPDIHLEGALDRFANFFISPLMSPDSISKEREAIESEFKLHLSSDSTRLEQLFCSTAPSTNPAHKFMWGNLITLQKNVNDKDLYNKLRTFRARHYSANRMTVAIQARLPINLLLTWVVQYFGEILNNEQPPLVFDYIDPPFDMDLFHKIYTVQPVKDINKLLITWAIPSVIQQYRAKPLSYLAYLIGHEGEGSLLAQLQEKLWALSVTAGNGNEGIENNSMYSLFTIDVSLTQEGLLNVEEVLNLIFSYIKLLQNTGPVESIFKEIQLIEDVMFRFIDEADASDYVEELSQNMQIYPPEDYIIAEQVILEYDPEKINNILNRLTPNSVNLMIASRTAAATVDLDKTEPWFNTKYNLKSIPQEWITKWTDCEPHPDFHLPKPNDYISSDFQILPPPDSQSEYPERIAKDDYIETWFKQDTEFKLPICFIRMYMISPTAALLPENKVMCDLFVSLFYLKIVKDVYPATVAGLSYKLMLEEQGLGLQVHGFNEKIPLLLEKLLNEIKTFSDNVSEGLFDAVKEETRKCYVNRLLKLPTLATELRLSILFKPYWLSIIKMNSLPHITLQKFQTFCKTFFENLYVKCLIQGNINQTQALDISNKIKEIIDYKPILGGATPIKQVRKLPNGENILRVESFNKDDPNFIVTNYYQYGVNSISEYCKMELLMMIMQEPLFDTLRTQEQLGYDISCESRITSTILGYTVTVKSQVDKFDIDYVEQRITEFLNKMKNDISKMPVAEFNQIKDSMKILRQQKHTDLKSEVSRNWSEITNDEYTFDRNKKEVIALESLTRADVTSFFSQLLKSNSTACPSQSKDENIGLRKLSIQVESKNNDGVTETDTQNNEVEKNIQAQYELQIKSPNDEILKDKFIDDIETFKNSLYIYPILASTKK